ncbi:MAG: reprolysin-like metallopeptidase [Betaproteobacteria bacterium]
MILTRYYRNSGCAIRVVRALIGAAFALSAAVSIAAGSPREPWRLSPAAIGEPSPDVTGVASPAARGVPSPRAGVHGIEFDPQMLDDWQPGTAGEFSLPRGRRFPIAAVRTEKHASGNRSWIGTFKHEGRHYVTVLTYGPAGIVGEIRTPDGPMLLELDGGRIVLVDTAEAGWKLPEPGESDALVPSQTNARTTDLSPAVDGGRMSLKAAPSPQTTIDVLIAYTPGMVSRHGSTAAALLRIDQLIATGNQAYLDSDVAITLRLAHAVEVAYMDGDDNSDALTNLTNGVGVLGPAKTTLRDRYGADIVALVRPFVYPNQAGCGVAWIGGYGGNGAAIGGQSANGFAVVSDGSDTNNSGYYCQNATFPHELGHNMGALHDRQTVSQGGTQALQVGAYNYSYGYVHNATFSTQQGANICNAGSGTSCFGTIMSYLSKASELKFSNPALITCPGGLTCGTASDSVALTLNNTRAGVASWRPTKVPFVGVPAGSGQSVGLNLTFGAPLKVTIRDAQNQIVPGVTVNFSAPASGASATLSAVSAVTDANGVAQVTATANGNSGSYVVTATATSGRVAGPFTFSLTNGSSGSTATLTVVVNGGGAVTGTGINCPGDCSASPTSGSVVALSAAPTAGKVFTGWLGGGCTGTGNCMVTVAAATTVSATFGASSLMPIRLDIDQNAGYDALTDGLLIARYLFGVTSTELTNGAIGAAAQRSDPAAVLSYLNSIAPALDVDGNGQADALTDGMLIIRYLFGLRGSILIQGAVGPGAIRTTASQIENYIASLLP